MPHRRPGRKLLSVADSTRAALRFVSALDKSSLLASYQAMLPEDGDVIVTAVSKIWCFTSATSSMGSGRDLLFRRSCICRRFPESTTPVCLSVLVAGQNPDMIVDWNISEYSISFVL